MPVVDNVAIMGGGIMGRGIGQTLLQNGYSVTIRDIEEEVLEETKERMINGSYGLERAVEGGYLTEAEMGDALNRLTLTTDIEEAVDGADFVLEAVTEDLNIKGQVFQDLDELTDDIPLFTNTSGFSITGLSNAVEDSSRVAGTHFFSPVPVMDFVEIIRGPATDDEVIELAEAVIDDIGKERVTITDDPHHYGFIVNRCWAAMREEARKVVREGIATEEQVNLAMREGRNLPVGPLEGPGLGEEWD
ncbi:3-hydroxyacyl-CoA dehydrogenase family protein [Natrinema soli]|uniref:3-hydroxyacyl-CoA dehydrogenase family protein n=1 Tax=Natrinema soli TaxID=1930624 RepID=A0ABD5SHB6_9EURY|nr:3-hydroxyacyl-CoA dehydrogenase family protein [Natrinema soli]